MSKILLSVDLLGTNLNEALEYNLDLLCSEFEFKLPQIISGLVKATTREEINTYLELKFPGQIKVVD
jgi:hypothetical protein